MGSEIDRRTEPVHLVVALQSEARPILDRYRLERARGTEPFAIYRGDGIRLVCSGVGRASVAAAVTALFWFERRPSARAWLNLGIAGGALYDDGSVAAPGDVRIASRLLAPEGETFYPPLLFDLPAPITTVRSVDRVERSYASPGLYEMEATGFVETASRFSPADLVQVMKVVSDTPEHPVERIHPKAIEERIAARLGSLDRMLEQLTRLAKSLPEADSSAETLMRDRHFTATQGRQLRELLRRQRALGIEPLSAVPDLGDLGESAGADDVLEALERTFEGAQLAFQAH